MLLTGLLIIAIAVSFFLFNRKQPLDRIPGPKGVPILGNALQLLKKTPYLAFAELTNKYGGIFKLKFPGSTMVVVSDPELVHEVFVTKGAVFGGRPTTFRLNVYSEGQSDVILCDASPAHKARRKLLHSYIKQFGSGIQKIEEITQNAVKKMISKIKEENGEPVAIEWTIRKCITDIMGILVIGSTLTEEELQDVTTLLNFIARAFEVGGDGEILDIFPFLRYFGNKTYKFLTTALKIQNSLVSNWMKRDGVRGYIAYVDGLSVDDQARFHVSSLCEKVNTCADFFAAGVITTTSTLTSLVHVLAHQPHIQQKLQQEIHTVIGVSRPVTVMDKEKMAYHQATILEIGRFASIHPLGLPHKATQDSTVGNYDIPAGTQLIANLWYMHHDEKLWDQPFQFVPERFLDDAGQLVPADHPNRKNRMVFGAGARVCVGEVFALTRMFLILSSLMQKFTVLPETTIDASAIDPRNMLSGITSNYPAFKVRMIPKV